MIKNKITTILCTAFLLLEFQGVAFAQFGDFFKKDGKNQWSRLISRVEDQESDERAAITFDTRPNRNPFEPQLPVKKDTPIETVTQEQPVRPTNPVRPVQPTPPVQNIAPQKAALPPLEISGIVWNSKKPQVIINKQVLGVGDIIENTRILEIKKTGVTLIYFDERVTLPYGNYQQQ